MYRLKIGNMFLYEYYIGQDDSDIKNDFIRGIDLNSTSFTRFYNYKTCEIIANKISKVLNTDVIIEKVGVEDE